MTVPYVFGTIPNGETIPLSYLDADFAYLEGQIGGTVDNIAALVNLPVTPGLNVYVSGYHTQGDSGGGTFYGSQIMPAGTYVTDNGTIFVPTGGDGSTAWIRTITDIVNVNMFGAVGDYYTDDSAAINAAIAYCKTFIPTNTMPSLFFGSAGKNYVYRVGSTLNFTGIRVSSGFLVDFQGCNIQGQTNGYPVIDALDTMYTTFQNVSIYGPPTNTPNYGLQMGRGIVGQDAANCALYNMNIEGNFTKACFLNDGCEVFLVEQCNFQNSDTGGSCVVIDSINLSNVQSQFFTVNVPVNVWTSLTINQYISCSFEQISLASTVPAIYVTGPISNFSFKTCYLQNKYGDGIWFRGNALNIGGTPLLSAMVEVDIRYEPNDIVNCVKFLTSAGPVSFRNFSFYENLMFGTNSFFTTDGGSNYCELVNSLVSIDNSYTTAPIFKPSVGQMYYSGVINIGSNAYLYDFSQLTGLVGQINCYLTDTQLILPPNNNVTVTSYNSNRTTYPGTSLFTGLFELSAGANIASASSITIPLGFAFYVTGSTNINSINYTQYLSGRLIWLISGGSFKIINNQANGFILNSDFGGVGQENSAILLYCNGSAWIEMTRTKNNPV